MPFDPYSDEQLRALETGRDVMTKIWQARNPKQHKLLFALNDPERRSVDDLLRYLKIAHRMFDPVVQEVTDVRTGEVKPRIFHVMRSISFYSMPQNEFRQVFDQFIDTIIADILPGIGRDELLAEVLEAVS